MTGKSGDAEVLRPVLPVSPGLVLLLLLLLLVVV
jgi:hypothetical protein